MRKQTFDPEALKHPRYPRSNGYDPAWIAENQMGPNALWLLESLTEIMPIEPGMRILDLGCGRAMTSIFLAKEFGARVWATDLWIDAEENQQRIVDAGVADLVTPIHAEAHALPFDKESFDAVISIDAYQYFGTDDLYIATMTDLLRLEGRIGCVLPALRPELSADGAGEIPATLAPFWEWELCCFHGPEWWQFHWEKTGKVRVDHADLIEDGWRDWLQFNDAIAPVVEGWWIDEVANTHDMLVADQGNHLGLTRIVATKSDSG